jgi:hypothetical protein
MTRNNDVFGETAFPRFVIAVPPNVSTIRSPIDGQEGLAVFWTRAAAKRVARTKPGTVVVEATPEMFMDAIRKTHEMGVPWMYIGSELGSSVDFQKVRLVMALGQYARDGQHRHGEPL